MKKPMFIAVMSVVAASATAGEIVGGGIKFNSAVSVDGVAYEAGSTIYAEAYPTQFVVKLNDGTTIHHLTRDSAHGGEAIFPNLNDEFVLMPPPTVGDVVAYTFTAANPLYVAQNDPNADDDTATGTEAKPFKSIAALAAKMRSGAISKSNYLIYVKEGEYSTLGTDPSSTDLGNRVSFAGVGKSVFMRAVDGPDKTSIVGAQDKSVTTGSYIGWGPNAYRCVRFGAGTQAIQGFTLKGGYTATSSDSVNNRKMGAAVLGESTRDSQVLDCVIEGNNGNNGIITYAKVIRCRIKDNASRAALLSGCSYVASSTLLVSEAVDSAESFSYVGSALLCNCTLGGTAVNTPVFTAGATAYNSIFVNGGKSRTATGYDSWAWNFIHYSQLTGFTQADPKLADASSDLRLTEASPCLDSITLSASSDYWKYATDDVSGNRLRISADGKLTAGAIQDDIVENYKNVLYVDPVNGNDADNDGWKRTRAKKTIAAAFASPNCAAGTTVYVEAGEYAPTAVDSGDGKGLCRVSVPAGVTLKSLGSAADTAIVGLTTGEDTGNVRCAILHKDSQLCGFTLKDGATDAESGGVKFHGGGVLSIDSSAKITDCVFTNNYSANRGGAVFDGICVRCRFYDNEAQVTGSAQNGGSMINCIIGSQKGGRTRDAQIYNCTFLPADNPSALFEAVEYTSSGIYCRNSVFLCLTRPEAIYQNCLIVTNVADIVLKKRSYDQSTLGATVKLLASAGVKADGTLNRFSAAIDAGDNSLYDASTYGELDVNGKARIVNRVIDMGAAEYDPSSCPGFIFIFK